jgi:uncharacterized protein YcgL (UPF0745 family)
LDKIKKANTKNFEFEEYDENVAIVTNLNGNYIFVEYIEGEDCFVVFDGGFTTTELLENFGDNKNVLDKLKKVLTKYQVNKVDESLYLDGSYATLADSIEKLINVENEMLYQ